MTPSTKLLAYLALVGSVLSLGMSAILVKWAGAPGPVSGFYRMAIAVVILAIPFAREVRRPPKPTRYGLWLAVLAGLFFAGDLAIWNTGALITSASNATFLGNTSAIWVGLGALVLFREKLATAFWVGLAVALVGIGVMVGTDFTQSSTLGWGSLLTLIAGFFYGGFLLVTQRAREHLSAFSSWWISALASTVGLLVVSLVLGQPITGYSTLTYFWLFVSALVSQVAGYLLINYALGHLPASIVSPTLLGQPIASAIYGVFLLNEQLSWAQLLGGALVLVGIWFVNQRAPATIALAASELKQ